MIVVWLEFLVCALVIGYAGAKLSLYGDVIADRTGLGGAWIGLVLISTVTSLPELMTGLSAVTAAGAVDIAFGGALGSCVINLLILVVVDFVHRGDSVYRTAAPGHVLSGSFGVLLIGFVGFNLVLSSYGAGGRFGHIGYATPIILGLYALAMRTIFRYEQANLAEHVKAVSPGTMTLRRAVTGYILASLVVAAAGIWLPFVAKNLSAVMNWEETFVGSLFVAFVTSIPEIVVTIVAVRIGSPDLAMGNLLGSNLFNIAILAVEDIFYAKGSLFDDVSPLHLMTVMAATMMTGVAIIGVFYRPRTRFFKAVGWISLILLTIYLVYVYVFFHASR